ncbi:MAG: hypothetical protein F2799_01815 [Actinobacteria bacterium]|uniref:Unannotated protein n=1 Tax=freshwater metagenome TaxID=449393 RepID=A0A6J7D778_9ZZZZ|nr:hypothetical protein [Actinomycetota bacterium]
MLDDGNGSNGSNGHGVTPLPPDEDGNKSLTVHWENMMSFRYWGGALGFGLFLMFVGAFAGLGTGTIQAFFIFGVAVSLLGGLVGRRYWCPYCRGMVKAGATVCRHCGRDFEI